MYLRPKIQCAKSNNEINKNTSTSFMIHSTLARKFCSYNPLFIAVAESYPPNDYPFVTSSS